MWEQSKLVKIKFTYLFTTSRIWSNAKRLFKKGDFINHHFEPGNKITKFGSYLNHSNNPTAISKKGDNGYEPVHALKDISKGDEITLNYKNRPDLEQPFTEWD